MDKCRAVNGVLTSTGRRVRIAIDDAADVEGELVKGAADAGVAVDSIAGEPTGKKFGENLMLSPEMPA